MAHWIIEDQGFGGRFYRCSNCGEFYWDISSPDIGLWDYCIRCNAPINCESQYLNDNAQTSTKTLTAEEHHIKSLENRLFLLTGCKCFGCFDPMDGSCVDCYHTAPDLHRRCTNFSHKYDEWCFGTKKER